MVTLGIEPKVLQWPSACEISEDLWFKFYAQTPSNSSVPEALTCCWSCTKKLMACTKTRLLSYTSDWHLHQLQPIPSRKCRFISSVICHMCTGNFWSKLEFSFWVSDPESIQKPLIRPAYLRATWDKPEPTKPSQMNALITPTRLQNRKNKDAQSKKAKKWETWNPLHVSDVSEVSGSLVPMPNWSLVERQPTVDSQFSDLPNVHPLDQKTKKHVNVWAFTCFHTKFGNLACIIISASISGGSGGIDLMPDLPRVLQNVTIFVKFCDLTVCHTQSSVPLQLRLDCQVLRPSKPSLEVH